MMNWAQNWPNYWNLPSEIVAVLRYHHRPDSAEAAEATPLARLSISPKNCSPRSAARVLSANYVAPEEWAALG